MQSEFGEKRKRWKSVSLISKKSWIIRSVGNDGDACSPHGTGADGRSNESERSRRREILRVVDPRRGEPAHSREIRPPHCLQVQVSSAWAKFGGDVKRGGGDTRVHTYIHTDCSLLYYRLS